MRSFIHDDFLLCTESSKGLYHEYAANLPIFDYHCHIPPIDIAHDRSFANLTQIWLAGDHYKWRAMRTNGVAEKYCTGEASDWEKFQQWAATVPNTLRNPLYHWTHLELKRFFGVDILLNSDTAREIWDHCNRQLNTPDFSVKNIVRKANVHTICTTDDPLDSLEHHQKIRESQFEVNVLPAWRPDRAMAIENLEDFNDYANRLGALTNIATDTFDHFMAALEIRHQYFHDQGCRLSDHGLETAYANDYSLIEIRDIFNKARAGKGVSKEAVFQFKSCMLHEFGLMDHRKGWTQQYHIGALRNNNSRMYRNSGPDIGFDSIGDFEVGRALSRMLDRLDEKNQLTKTILYNLNPRDNELFATMIGNFQDGSVPGKIQFGSGWWFLDQKDGMERQIQALSSLGLLSRFVGMLTDSRSFLSYTRHEYFRRILCNILGKEMESGEIPSDMELVGGMVRNICFHNAENYFGFPKNI